MTNNLIWRLSKNIELSVKMRNQMTEIGNRIKNSRVKKPRKVEKNVNKGSIKSKV